MRPSLSAGGRTEGVIGTLSTIQDGAREVKPPGRGGKKRVDSGQWTVKSEQ